MKKVFKFVKGKKELPRESAATTPSQPGELSSPAGTPEDEKFLSLDASSGYIVDFCGKDKSLTKLHKAAWQGHLEKLKSALKKTEIDAVDRHNRSALHFAVAQGHPNIVWYLLGNNAKMTISDDDGCTPLLKAIECGHKDCATLLLERGADVGSADYHGNTGLHVAVRQGNLDVASVLLSRGAAVDAANNGGERPLHVATRSQNKEMVELLLRGGASVNVFDRENRTPLMLAAKTGNLHLAQLFCEYGAHLTVVDSNGWTAEDYALLGGHETVANELKSCAKAKDAERDALERGDGEGEKKPGGQEEEKAEEEEEEESGSKSNEDSGTWQATSSESKKPVAKQVKDFFQGREKEEELSEDSPESEAMPPPCQPPKSWEMIQAGMIDAKQEGSEAKRRSITVLGTLRSRRESFTEASAGLQETARYTLSLNRRRPVKRENSFAKQRLSFNEEESIRSWMTDTSSTLKEIDKMELDEIRKADVREGGSGSEREGEASGARGRRPPSPPRKEDGDRSSWDSEESASQEAEGSFPPPPSGIELGVNMAKSMGYMKGISIDHPVGNVLERNLRKTSREAQPHSADAPDEQEPKAADGGKRHARHRSISAHKWRSEEISQSHKSADRSVDANRRINEQLQCYDQALRELAETSFSKKQGTRPEPDYRSLPGPKQRAAELRDDRRRGEWPEAAAAGGSGPLSLPHSVNIADAEKAAAEPDADASKKSKRHMLLAMREVKHAIHVSNAFGASVDDQILSPLTKPPDGSDSEDDGSGPGEEQHFFRPDFRQETVIERKSSGSGTGEEPTLWLRSSAGPEPPAEAKKSKAAAVEKAAACGGSPGEGSGGDDDECRPIAQDLQSPDISFSSGPIEPIGGKDSGSEADSTHNEVSPTHNYTLQTHHEWLKNHLKSTTSEKNKLEQAAVELSERTERLQYELADAKEAIKSKDEVILLLQSQLSKMERAYTRSLEESVQSRLQLTTHEQEILHLKEACYRYEEEKERMNSEADEDDRAELRSQIRVLEEEKEKMGRDILRLEQEKSALEKRLQEATASEIIDQCQRWKERFEMADDSLKPDDPPNVYLAYLKTLSQEHLERERKLSERNEHLEKMLMEANQRNEDLDARLQAVVVEVENERLKASLKTELSGPVSEMNRRNAEMEAQIRRLEKEMEERSLRGIREKEEEMQAVVQQFAAERETLVRNYESRIAELRQGESDQERESWRKENEKLRLTVRHLQEQFANLQVKSTLEETNESLKKELSELKEQCNLVSKSIIEIQNKGKQELDSLMRENLNLKREINEFKVKLMRDEKGEPNYKEDLMKVVSEHTHVKSEMIELKSQMQHMEEMLSSERGLLQEYKERNAGLEQQIMKLTADGKGTGKPEGGAEGKQSRKRGVGREDQLAWTNLYGIKQAGKGREGSVSADDCHLRGEVPAEAGGGGEGRCGLARGSSTAADQEYERSREEMRQRVEANFHAEEERKAKQVMQSCELLELKRQILLLQNRMADEKSTRSALENRIAELDLEVREKQRLEAEVAALRRRIERELVPRAEAELLRHERDLLERRQRLREEQEPEEERSLPGGDYRAKCERFAEELENSKKIRRKVESGPNGFQGLLQGERRRDGGCHEAVRPCYVPAQVATPAADLEPEVKSRLNEELDRSIKRHLTDLSVAAGPKTELNDQKLLP